MVARGSANNKNRFDVLPMLLTSRKMPKAQKRFNMVEIGI